MPRFSRRALLAGIGATVLSGCSTSDGEQTTTATPYDVPITTVQPDVGDPELPREGPDPLGYRALPPNAAAVPEFHAENIVERDQSQYPAGVFTGETTIKLLTNNRNGSSYEQPTLYQLDEQQRVTAATDVTGTVTDHLWLSECIGNTLFVGGYERDPDRTWIRGFGGSETVFEHWTAEEPVTRISALTALDGALLGIGRTERMVAGQNRSGIVTQFEADGAVAWERLVAHSGSGTRLYEVSATADGILAGGVNNDTGWLVMLEPDGQLRWERPLPQGERDYTTAAVAAGKSGMYALAQTKVSEPSSQLYVLSLDDTGGIEWLRVFDPDPGNRDRQLRGGDIVEHDGPVVVGNDGQSVWMASLTPDGSVQWAGRHRYTQEIDEYVTRADGLTVVEERPLVYGIVARRAYSDATVHPWLAWL